MLLWGLHCSGPSSQVLGLRPLVLLSTNCAPRQPGAELQAVWESSGLPGVTWSQNSKDKERGQDTLGGTAVDTSAKWTHKTLI